jgi:hypothetical protein
MKKKKMDSGHQLAGMTKWEGAGMTVIALFSTCLLVVGRHLRLRTDNPEEIPATNLPE